MFTGGPRPTLQKEPPHENCGVVADRVGDGYEEPCSFSMIFVVDAPSTPGMMAMVPP